MRTETDIICNECNNSIPCGSVYLVSNTQPEHFCGLDCATEDFKSQKLYSYTNSSVTGYVLCTYCSIPIPFGGDVFAIEGDGSGDCCCSAQCALTIYLENELRTATLELTDLPTGHTMCVDARRRYALQEQELQQYYNSTR